MIGAYLSSLYSYLLFHSLAEIFSIVIGCSIFILAWNSRQFLENKYLLLLGIAYLFVSFLDLIHGLAYKGMGVFPGFDSNLSTQLWIAARYVQSLSLLLATVFLRRKLNVSLVFFGYLLVTALLITAIFSGHFPVCFVEGSGLTWFKKISEYIISFLLLAATGLLLQRRAAFEKDILRNLVVSLLLTIGAELAFTYYINVYGLSNLVGHFFKMIAFYLVYKAILETGLEKPHRLLFRNLQQSETALRNALETVQKMAVTDYLTGLYNRRYFLEVTEREIQRAYRYKRTLSVIMIDIDHFKQVNDTYGHAVGDRVLQAVAHTCREGLRGIDLFSRYGGEEFTIMLPETDLAAAGRVAERLREHIAQINLQAGSGFVSVTASFGVSSLKNEQITLESLLQHADQALYSAKQSGRNRVCSI